jgi:hypothetical protein
VTDDQIIEFLTEGFTQVRQAQGATAATVRSLVTALREGLRERQSDDSRLAILEKAVTRFEQTNTNVEQALVQLIAHVSPRDLSKIGAEELVGAVPIETIRRARDIHWARSRGDAEPLPPPPNVPQLIEQETSSGHVEIVPVHYHRRKDDDNSVAIKTSKHGKTMLKANVEVKKLGGWVVAVVVFAVLAWREIQRAYEPHPGQEQRQAPMPSPSLPVPQLSPPIVPMPSPTGVHP